MSHPDCTQDGFGCSGGADGGDCPGCEESRRESMEDALGSWQPATADKAYAEEMIDAGRAHLLTLDERGLAS